MTDASHPLIQPSQPPPAPPLPPTRAGVLQRIIAPLSFNLGARPHGSQPAQSNGARTQNGATRRIYRQLPSQTTAHRTGIPIAALDINRQKTHAILAGQGILKTVRIQDGKAVEDFNLRSAINSPASVYGARSDAANQRRDYLPATDVKWSNGDRYDTIIATAAINGRIALYDVSRLNSSRVELAWIHEHTGQVNKIDFDATRGGGYLLLSGSQDKTVRIWDIRERTSVIRKQQFNVRHPVRDVRWSPTDPGEFALCTGNGNIQRWDLRMPSQALFSINGAHEKACYTIDWHPDGRHLASGGMDKHVRVWDLKSENRKQRPTVQFRTPQAVMNLAWRPAGWSAELAETGILHSTQLATSYTDDDPRVHIWDLRQPLLPIRELDRYNSRPTDLTWATKDFLWTVGNEGMFTQNDIRYASLVQDDVPPCAISFTSDGGIITFTEDTDSRRRTSFDQPTTDLLRVPGDQLGGNSEGAISRSLSDDDADERLVTSARSRQSRSSRSAKSQGNTPPNQDGSPHILPFDRSMSGRVEAHLNEQVGVASSISGVAADPAIIEFLAENYARPSSADERKQEPSTILQKLDEAFLRNADVCDYVSMHRLAQSWRILAAVVVPELRDWADQNRDERLKLEASKKLSEAVQAPKSARPSSQSKGLTREAENRPLTKSQKVVHHIFRGVAGSDRSFRDSDSTSNIATPLAMPLPDSPYNTKPSDGNFMSLSDMIEPIPPLPPAVINSHSTAAAASRALLDGPSDQTDASNSAGENRRPPEAPFRQHKRTTTDLSVRSAEQVHRTASPLAQAAPKSGSSPLAPRSPMLPITQETRRAALRDYRAPTRQLFTLDTPDSNSHHESRNRHDSSESFPMFSASTDSSHKARSLGQSFASPVVTSKVSRDSNEWQMIRPSDSDSTPPSGERPNLAGQEHFDSFGSSNAADDLSLDGASHLGFDDDGAAKSKTLSNKAKVSDSAKIWKMDDYEGQSTSLESETAASSASDQLFHFEQAQAIPRTTIYASNPIRRIASTSRSVAAQQAEIEPFVADDDVSSREYQHGDFRPIDFTTYEPNLPFAWSALPLVCHSIAFDTLEGIACAQFSIHLLMHLHPFFFHQAVPAQIQPAVPAPESLADRLMRPDLCHRIFEGLFVNHYNYLQVQGLFGPMSEVRQMCAEFGYDSVYRIGEERQSVGAGLKKDSLQIQVSCSECHAVVPTSGTVCHNCWHARDGCPICLLRDCNSGAQSRHGGALFASGGLWTFCQACGHAAHKDCMQDWLLQPDSNGECPTTGCGCDCGPGLLRQQRLDRRIIEAENADAIRGLRGGPPIAKRDPVKANASPAVDKTRSTLRQLDLRDRGTQSSDEGGKRNVNSRSNNRGGISMGGSSSRAARESFGRRVRLVTPDESASSPSRS